MTNLAQAGRKHGKKQARFWHFILLFQRFFLILQIPHKLC